MKNESKTDNRKQTNKKKVVKASKNTNRKTGRKKVSSAISKPVRRAGNRRGKLSKGERENLKILNRLIREDKGIKEGKIIKSGDLFTIKLPQKTVQQKIQSLIKTDFKIIDKYLKSRKIEPLYFLVVLKIEKPDTDQDTLKNIYYSLIQQGYTKKEARNEVNTNYYYNSQLSPADMVVKSENVKQHVIESVIEYNNYYIDFIHNNYDEPIEVYNILEVSVRFLFRR